MGHIENYLFNRKCVTPTKSIFLNFLAFWLFFAVTGSSAIHLPPLHLRFARLQIRFSFSSFLFFPPDKSETQISILARLVITCRQTKTRVITNHNRPDKATNQSYWSYNVTQPASSSGKQVHSSLGCDWTLIGRENAVRIFSQSYHRIENLRQRQTANEFSTDWKLVRSGFPFTWNQAIRMKIWTPSPSKSRVNRAKILNGLVWTKCPVKFFSRSKIRPVPSEARPSHQEFSRTVCKNFAVEKYLPYESMQTTPCQLQPQHHPRKTNK